MAGAIFYTQLEVQTMWKWLLQSSGFDWEQHSQTNKGNSQFYTTQVSVGSGCPIGGQVIIFTRRNSATYIVWRSRLSLQRHQKPTPQRLRKREKWRCMGSSPVSCWLVPQPEELHSFLQACNFFHLPKQLKSSAICVSLLSLQIPTIDNWQKEKGCLHLILGDFQSILVASVLSPNMRQRNSQWSKMLIPW